MNQMVEKERIEYLDLLRGFATLAVVFYHSRPSLETGEVPHQLIAVLLNWCVPMFLMITGTLFLNHEKEVTYTGIIRYQIFNTLKVIVFWGFVYNFLSTFLIERIISADIIAKSLTMTFIGDTSYCYQFWYLYLLVGLYLILPVIKTWTDKYTCEEKMHRECQIMCICFGFLSIVLPTFCNGFGIGENVWHGAFFAFSGYVFYILCGHIIGQYGLGNKIRAILGVTLIIQVLFFVYKVFERQHISVENWYGYTSFFTWNMTVIIYDCMRRLDFSKINTIIKKLYYILAKHSLGIYIFHVMVLQMLRKCGLTSALINPWVFPIVSVLITVCISVVATIVCKRLPVIKEMF